MSNTTSYKDSSQYEIPRKTNTLFLLRRMNIYLKKKDK